jgi:hypothetical protein
VLQGEISNGILNLHPLLCGPGKSISPKICVGPEVREVLEIQETPSNHMAVSGGAASVRKIRGTDRHHGVIHQQDSGSQGENPNVLRWRGPRSIELTQKVRLRVEISDSGKGPLFATQ